MTATEVIEQAQYRIGSAQYRAYKAQVGSYPNEEQRAWLKNVRTKLNEKYPGFPVVPIFTVGEWTGVVSSRFKEKGQQGGEA